MFSLSIVMGPRRNSPRTKLRSAGKDSESEQMATCHLTNQQNHSLQLPHEIFCHYYFSLAVFFHPHNCVHLSYKTHLACSGEQLGKQPKQKKKNQTRTSPSDSNPRGNCKKQHSGNNTLKKSYSIEISPALK